MLFMVFILKLSLRPWRLIHPARDTRKSVAGWGQGGSGMRRGSSSVEWAHDVGERGGSQERRKTMGPDCAKAQLQVMEAFRTGTLVSVLRKQGSEGITVGQEGSAALLWGLGLRH